MVTNRRIGSRTTAWLVAGSLAWVGCAKGNTSANAPEASAPPVEARSASDASANANGASATATNDASAGASANANARATWSGEATGQGAEPPIHEYVRRVVADSWNATGTVRLDVPDGDGPVSGTLSLGGLTFRVNGFRTASHVRGTMEQEGSGSAASGADLDRGAEFYRGTLDAEVAADAIRGTWEASAQAGMHRRRGTIAARR